MRRKDIIKLSTLLVLYLQQSTGSNSQCPQRSLSKHLTPSGEEEIWSFPTQNRLFEGNLSLWRRSNRNAESLVPNSAAIPTFKAVVFFYYGPHDPYSTSLRPVMECLPKFFPPSVLFFAVDHSRLPSNMQLNNGILSTPSIRLLRNREDKQFYYAGRERSLVALISFVEEIGHVKAVATPAALGMCGGASNCACTAQALPVSAVDIKELGNNRWMLVACLFLAVLGVEAWAKGRRNQQP